MEKNILSIIVAASDNNVIGKDNDLIWHLPADMKFFKDTTTGHPVIMGRKNYESIPLKYRPLSNRTNIIVSRQNNFTAPGCLVCNSIEAAINKAKEISEGEIFIIGGAQIYAQTIDLVDKIYLTRVHHQFEGDAHFPELNTDEFDLKSSLFVPADVKNQYGFTIYIYKRKN